MTINHPQIINPARLKVECKKCEHEAEIVLSIKVKHRTDKIVCSHCGAKGWDLVIEYLD